MPMPIGRPRKCRDVVVYFYASDDLKCVFRSVCTKRGTNMAEQFRNFMRKSIREEGSNFKENKRSTTP